MTCQHCNNPTNNEESDPIYYRIILGRDNKITLACLQSFDEYDYDQDAFLDEEHYHCKDAANSRIAEIYEENKETAFAQLFDAPSLFQVLKMKIKEREE